MRNVHRALAEGARTAPESVRVVDADGRRWTNRQLAARMFAVQEFASSCGAARVSAATRSAGEFWSVALGVTGAGGDFIPLSDTSPRSVLDRVRSELSPSLHLDDEVLAGVPEAGPERVPGEGGVILLSSGTTGRSRFVHRACHAVEWIASGLRDSGIYRDGDRVVAVLPLHHAYGFEHAFLGPALAGASVHHGHRFDPADARDALAGATVLATVPAALRALLDVEPHGVAPDRVVTAGTALSAALRRRAERAMPSAAIVDLYGATELGTIWIDRGTGGMPVPGVEVRIASGQAGQAGEVLVRSASRLHGFVGCHDAPVDADGWFSTGDVGRALPGGGFAIVGRSKLIFDVGGLKVNPYDVEAALEEHPSVRAAIVVPIGVADDLVRVGARIELSDPHGDRSTASAILRSHLRDRVPAHAIPRHFDFVDRLPRTASGKVIREPGGPVPSAASPTTRRREEFRDTEVRRRWTTELFDRSAAAYDWSSAVGAGWTDEWYRRRQLLAAGLGPGCSLLDVGGGTGRSSVVAMRIVGPAGRVVLVDPSPGMGAVAKRRGVNDVRIGFAESLPVEPSAFDVVLLAYMLRHVEDMDAAFAQAFRALRPMGRIIILEVTEPNGRVGRTVFRWAARRVLPAVSMIGSGSAAAHSMMAYWAETMADAAAPQRVVEALNRTGFVGTRHRRELGIFSSYRGVKP